MTPQQIADHLGLQDFRFFAQESMWNMADLRFKTGSVPVSEVMHRRQGHSTRNLLAALCHLTQTDERVLLVAHNLDLAKVLQKQAGDWALALGLDPRRIKVTTPRSKGRAGWHERQVFVDHVVHEFSEAA
jgi:hypothetical protein